VRPFLGVVVHVLPSVGEDGLHREGLYVVHARVRELSDQREAGESRTLPLSRS
jgi:hypothetical protein